MVDSRRHPPHTALVQPCERRPTRVMNCTALVTQQWRCLKRIQRPFGWAQQCPLRPFFPRQAKGLQRGAGSGNPLEVGHPPHTALVQPCERRPTRVMNCTALVRSDDVASNAYRGRSVGRSNALFDLFVDRFQDSVAGGGCVPAVPELNRGKGCAQRRGEDKPSGRSPSLTVTQPRDSPADPARAFGVCRVPSPRAGEPARLSLPAPSPPRPATGVIAPRDRSAA